MAALKKCRVNGINQMELNRRCFLQIVETLQFLIRQELALHGDNSDDYSNFI